MIDYRATGLPIVPFLPEVASLLAEGGALCLAAEPGAGKTSLVPPWLAESGRVPGRIIVLEPRRIAAVGAAARMAELMGEGLGAGVGYRVRQDSRVGPSTRIIAMTPGVLVRIMQDDPGLAGIGAIVFDEFHERSVQADLCLALALEARALRADLLLLLMSATLDAERAAEFLGARILAVPGRSHPIAVRHAPLAEGRGFEEGFAALALGLAAEAQGDVLAFLPGGAEIERARRALEAAGMPAFALHGSLPLEAQRAVIAPRPSSPRRVILATSIAETSLTVPRVAAVLDSGLARLSRFHVRTGLNRLVTERESADRAEQRKGRAGRLGPGLCLRAWAESEILSPRTEPEILRSELSALVLESALWGARGRADLPWLDPPPEPAWEAGRELLAELGAIEAGGRITAFGKRMAGLGTEPRLAALVLRGQAAGLAEEACLAAALLSEGETGGERDLAARIGGLMARGARATGGDAR
ncbi:MAG TPA: helicase-related protein, partial [Rectinemataceae bacterium]|nr:helicase-related protein [Rectinemataceae bacterium]